MDSKIFNKTYLHQQSDVIVDVTNCDQKYKYFEEKDGLVNKRVWSILQDSDKNI